MDIVSFDNLRESQRHLASGGWFFCAGCFILASTAVSHDALLVATRAAPVYIVLGFAAVSCWAIHQQLLFCRSGSMLCMFGPCRLVHQHCLLQTVDTDYHTFLWDWDW